MTVTPEDLAASMARHPAGATERHLSLVPDLPLDWDEILEPTGEPVPVGCPGAGRPPCMVLDVGRGLCIVCADPVALSPDGRALLHERDDLMTRLVRGDYD